MSKYLRQNRQMNAVFVLLCFSLQTEWICSVWWNVWLFCIQRTTKWNSGDKIHGREKQAVVIWWSVKTGKALNEPSVVWLVKTLQMCVTDDWVMSFWWTDSTESKDTVIIIWSRKMPINPNYSLLLTSLLYIQQINLLSFTCNNIRKVMYYGCLDGHMWFSNLLHLLYILLSK